MDLEAAIKAKEGPLKLAETRLENRTNRPHIELTNDLPLDGLIAEVNAIKMSIQKLDDKLDNARYGSGTKRISPSGLSLSIYRFPAGRP